MFQHYIMLFKLYGLILNTKYFSIILHDLKNVRDVIGFIQFGFVVTKTTQKRVGISIVLTQPRKSKKPKQKTSQVRV